MPPHPAIPSSHGAPVSLSVLRRLMDPMPVGFYRSTPDGRFLYANPALVEILGYPDVDTFLSTPAVRLYDDPEDRRRWLEEMEAGGEVRGFEVRIRRRDGGTGWVRHTTRRVTGDGDDAGRVVFLEGFVEDISEIQEAQEERDREAGFIRLLEEVAVAANEARRPEDAYLEALWRISGLTGWPVGHVLLSDPEDPAILRPTDLWHLDDPVRFERFRRRTMEFVFRRGQGIPGQVADTGTPSWFPDIRFQDVVVRGDEARETGLAAALAFPVLAEEEVVAVVELFATEPHPPDDRLLEVLGQVGVVLGRVEERARATRRVHDLNAKLEERVRRRTAELRAGLSELESFTYTVSHDLRAPLRAMAGYSEALLEDHSERLDAEGRHYLERIRAGSGRMGQLITDLLTLSRISRRELERVVVDLSALARTVTAELEEAEPRRRVKVTIADGLLARGDPRLVRLALTNLLDNAWKFTRKTEFPHVELGCRSENGDSVFFVRDNGIGFDMRYADKLFGAFQRLHRLDEFPGTGIGLATVDRIVRRHGGRVWAESAAGGGATFLFTLDGGTEA